MQRSHSFLILCALHVVNSTVLWWARDSSVETLIWQADMVWQAPWQAWTTVWVHMNPPHMIVNQMVMGLLTALAWVVRPPLLSSMAWCLAWPLTHMSLLLWSQVGYVAGLSGVIHGGFAVIAVHLMMGRIPIAKHTRWGALLMLVLLSKLGFERAWDYPVVWDAVSEISTVQASALMAVLWSAGLAWLLGWGEKRFWFKMNTVRGFLKREVG